MELFNTIIIIIGLLWEVWYCSIVLRPYLLHHQVTGIWKYLPHKRRCDHQTAENTLAAVSLENLLISNETRPYIKRLAYLNSYVSKQWSLLVQTFVFPRKSYGFAGTDTQPLSGSLDYTETRCRIYHSGTVRVHREHAWQNHSNWSSEWEEWHIKKMIKPDFTNFRWRAQMQAEMEQIR